MIIDQLTPTPSDNLTDEVPVEQGTATFKTTWQKILNLFFGNLVPTSGTPAMDGTASQGTASTLSRSDHVHPNDTSKQDTLVSGTNIKTINGNSILGSGDLSAGGALYLTNLSCSAMTGNFVNYNDPNITADHVVAEVTFANPSAITTDVTWTTTNGYITLNGTCASATTVNIVLVLKNN